MGEDEEEDYLHANPRIMRVFDIDVMDIVVSYQNDMAFGEQELEIQ